METPAIVLATDLSDANRLTWHQLEYILGMLRQHKRIEIRCEGSSGPFISDLISELAVVKPEVKT